MRGMNAQVLTITLRRECADLCYRHNAATNPAICRTDHEHARQRQIARAIRNRMKRLRFVEGIDYKEWDSGRYWPIDGAR